MIKTGSTYCPRNPLNTRKKETINRASVYSVYSVGNTLESFTSTPLRRRGCGGFPQNAGALA
jgi:hypothetical protein